VNEMVKEKYNYVCEYCGLKVDVIPKWKKNECPNNEYQHNFITQEDIDLRKKECGK
jgi:peptide subunit release factor 1 (eRF1)